ncbi:MAG: ligase-associated DNA damage response endonuclease PdeM [Woeseiaceae bacterium]
MSAVLAIEVRGELLQLSEERALFWPARSTLMVADWHLGKAAVFSRRGLAIPEGDLAYDLQRLDALLALFRPSRLVVLGDLMHAPPVPADRWPARLSAWLAEHPALTVEIVAGNHDRVDPVLLPDGLSTRLVWHPDVLFMPPFVLAHEPTSNKHGYVIAGHIHPTRVLSGGADRVRSPAFWWRRDYAVLPAFGSFTGGHNIRPARDDRVFVTGPGAVIEVSKT